MYSLQTLRTRGLLSLAATAALAVPSVLFAPPASAAMPNGGFETGTLTGRTSAGATAVVGSGAHRSTYAARVGGTSHPKDDSTLRLVSHDDDHRGAPTFARFDDVQLTAAPALTQIDTDPFTNSTSQHATVVEPDTFASGNTVIAVAQNGRFFNGGASGLGWARSADGGVTWTHGTIPGITVYQGGAFSRVSDPSVVYDARHATWLVAGLPLNST
ncbi:hypothetical protein AB0C13_39195, partial [Streptomyces sp. NPDC049099]